LKALPSGKSAHLTLFQMKEHTLPLSLYNSINLV